MKAPSFPQDTSTNAGKLNVIKRKMWNTGLRLELSGLFLPSMFDWPAVPLKKMNKELYPGEHFLLWPFYCETWASFLSFLLPSPFLPCFPTSFSLTEHDYCTQLAWSWHGRLTAPSWHGAGLSFQSTGLMGVCCHSQFWKIKLKLRH